MIPEMLELEKVHGQLHDIIRLVIQKKNSGDSDGAKIELEKAKSVSNKVVELLLHMEEKIKSVDQLNSYV